MLTLNRNRGSFIYDMETGEMQLVRPALIVSEIAGRRMYGLLCMFYGTRSFCSFSIDHGHNSFIAGNSPVGFAGQRDVCSLQNSIATVRCLMYDSWKEQKVKDRARKYLQVHNHETFINLPLKSLVYIQILTHITVSVLYM